MVTPLLCAFDPSIKCTGALVLELARPYRLVEAAALATEPRVPDRPALPRVRDEARRGIAIAAFVHDVLVRHPSIALIALEAPLGSQDVAAAAFLARANQAVAVAVQLTRPDLATGRMMFVSSYGAKRAATGTKRPDDAKRDVRRACERRWGPSEWERVFNTAPSVCRVLRAPQREACYDAGAVALCALEQPIVHVILEDYAREHRALEAL